MEHNLVWHVNSSIEYFPPNAHFPTTIFLPYIPQEQIKTF